jgi:hypothetical protein
MLTTRLTVLLICLSSVVALTACEGGASTPTAEPIAVTPTGEGAPAAPGATDPGAAAPGVAAPAAAPGAVQGKVVETMNSGGYTYVALEKEGAKVWAAGPQVPVKVGDMITLSAGMPMKNYHSKTLDRTFDVVYFVQAITVAGGEPAEAPTSATGAAPADGEEAGGKAEPTEVMVIKDIAKAEGGKTVAEVFAEKAALSGKEVVLRGKVVKYNSGIMGKNWLHVQDGSGAAGSNDLTITTQDEVAAGATVLVKGKIATGRDFGAGYAYDVMIEEAKVTAE